MASSPERPSLTTTFSSSRPAWIGQGSPLTSSRDISHLSRGLLCLEVGGRPAGRQASHHLAISVVPCTGSKSRGIPWRYCIMREVTGRRRGFLHSGWVRALVVACERAKSRQCSYSASADRTPLSVGSSGRTTGAVARPSSMGFSRPRDRTCGACTAGRRFTAEPPLLAAGRTGGVPPSPYSTPGARLRSGCRSVVLWPLGDRRMTQTLEDTGR